jgi:hypothetical protein
MLLSQRDRRKDLKAQQPVFFVRQIADNPLRRHWQLGMRVGTATIWLRSANSGCKSRSMTSILYAPSRCISQIRLRMANAVSDLGVWPATYSFILHKGWLLRASLLVVRSLLSPDDQCVGVRGPPPNRKTRPVERRMSFCVAVDPVLRSSNRVIMYSA